MCSASLCFLFSHTLYFLFSHTFYVTYSLTLSMFLILSHSPPLALHHHHRERLRERERGREREKGRERARRERARRERERRWGRGRRGPGGGERASERAREAGLPVAIHSGSRAWVAKSLRSPRESELPSGMTKAMMMMRRRKHCPRPFGRGWAAHSVSASQKHFPRAPGRCGAQSAFFSSELLLRPPWPAPAPLASRRLHGSGRCLSS